MPWATGQLLDVGHKRATHRDDDMAAASGSHAVSCGGHTESVPGDGPRIMAMWPPHWTSVGQTGHGLQRGGTSQIMVAIIGVANVTPRGHTQVLAMAMWAAARLGAVSCRGQVGIAHRGDVAAVIGVVSERRGGCT